MMSLPGCSAVTLSSSCAVGVLRERLDTLLHPRGGGGPRSETFGQQAGPTDGKARATLARAFQLGRYTLFLLRTAHPGATVLVHALALLL